MPKVAHDLVVKVNIVLTDEMPAEVLASLREMMQVGAGVARAGGAMAQRIERTLDEFVNAPPQLQKAARSKGAAALRDLRGDNAVEHVHPAVHRFEDVEGRCPRP